MQIKYIGFTFLNHDQILFKLIWEPQIFRRNNVSHCYNSHINDNVFEVKTIFISAIPCGITKIQK